MTKTVKQVLERVRNKGFNDRCQQEKYADIDNQFVVALSVDQALKELEALVRHEKTKLLAEVRERVVGEGELVDAEILKKLYDKAYSNGYNDKGYESLYNSRDYRSAEDIYPVIAKIRGGYDKRFAALNKLEAEL